MNFNTDRVPSPEFGNSPNRNFAYDFGNIKGRGSNPTQYAWSNNQYSVTFQLKFETTYGETIAVLGSTKELGGWDKTNVIYHLKWTEGHVWKSEVPLSPSMNYFRYKYVKMDQHGKRFVNYERGIDRIADLSICQGVQRGNIKEINFSAAAISA